MSLHDDLIAAGLPVSGTAIEGTTVLWTRPLTPGEEQIAQRIINPGSYYQQIAADVARNIPGWATWTQEQFITWCDTNLMTDAQIDATNLSAALKANIKANNAFTRNAGKLLIALRDHTRITW